MLGFYALKTCFFIVRQLFHIPIGISGIFRQCTWFIYLHSGPKVMAVVFFKLFFILLLLTETRNAAEVSFKNISILGWHYKCCCLHNWPGRLNGRFTLSQIARLCSNKASLSAGWNLNHQCRTHLGSCMCCFKSIQPIYIKISKHQNSYVIDALATNHRNRGNLAYLFWCLRKTAITFGRSVYCD